MAISYYNFYTAGFFRLNLLYVLICIFVTSNAQESEPKFHNLRDDFPAIEPHILSIHQDDRGFLWFGAETVFQKFDGYSVKSFMIHSFYDSSEEYFSGYQCIGFLNDRKEYLWVILNSGLLFYNHHSESFTRIQFELPFKFFYGTNLPKPSNIFITSFLEDNESNLWLGTDIGLLFYFSLDSIREFILNQFLPPPKVKLEPRLITPVKYRRNIGEEYYSEYRELEMETNRFSCPNLLKLFQDRDGDIWLNTQCRLYRITRVNNEWKQGGEFFKNLPVKGNRLFWTKNVFLDDQRNLWIGAGEYLFLKKKGAGGPPMPDIFATNLDIMGPVSSDFKRDFHFHPVKIPDQAGFQGNTARVNNIHYFSDDQIFLVNQHQLIRYSLNWENNEPVFRKIWDSQIPNPINKWLPYLSNLWLTKEGILFASAYLSGVMIFDMNHLGIFRKLYSDETDHNSLPKLFYSSIMDMGNDCILLGGRENTIYRTDDHFNTFYKLPLILDNTGNIDTYISKMVRDGYGRLWILNFLGQLAVFKESCINNVSDRQNCSRQIKLGDLLKNSSQEIPLVRDIAIHNSGIIWIASAYGLFFLDLKKLSDVSDGKELTFISYSELANEQKNNEFKDIYYILPIDSSCFILTTNNSWYQFDPSQLRYWKICEGFENVDCKPSTRVSFLDIDDKGQVWSTEESKISRITFSGINTPPCRVSITTFKPEDGFPERFSLIVTDQRDNLWLYPVGAGQGFIRYYIPEKSFEYYNGPGIISGTVLGGLHGKDSSGRLYFGAIDGITVFHPDSVKLNSYIPPVALTDIKILHRSIFQERDSARMITYTHSGTITLKPFEKTISIDFTALSYSNPDENQYAYFLEGFDTDTIFTDASNRTATYSNLDPGTYRFFVKGSNNHNVWNNQGASLTLIVLPPWYATTPAYIVYVLILAGLITAWRFYDLRRIRLKHEVELEHARAEKLEEVDHMKSEFFSNISHEFRTPLTLILGPLENIINGNFTGNLKKEAEIMKRNASRLLRLINQILDLSKLDAGKMKLHAAENDLVVFVRDFAANFESAARNKKIELTTYLPKNPLNVFFDAEKMEDILDNLIDNALKFTPPGGKVVIRLRMNRPGNGSLLPTHAEISVQDTGKGIAGEELDKIFNRFYQVDSSHTRKHEGAGIGLSLVNELVKLHYGTISVQSKPGKGTVFTILLPLGKEHLSEMEIVPSAPQSTDYQQHYNKSDIGILQKFPQEGFFKDNDAIIRNSLLPLVLIVEDNADMKHYIRNNLDHQFVFTEAENGIRGFQIAAESIPDLIISDLMMPGMDGYEFCRKIREDERTRHIPIIMLTAKAGKENRITGYDCGVDDYIIKPFDHEILIARMTGLIRERRLLREKFTHFWVKGGVEIATKTGDEKFIKRINEILEKNYGNPAFGTRLFVKEAGLSRSVLFRKLKAVTNLSPNSYIRNFRLIKAYQVISLGETDISSAAYAAGFNNLSYFSRSFKQLFKKSPHDFYARDKV